MFSSTGNWKNDCFDGCIAEIDLETGKRSDDLIKNLYMPHQVQFMGILKFILLMKRIIKIFLYRFMEQQSYQMKL